MRINTNISSLMSYCSLASSTGKLEKSIARLSTGLKINTAADDAAGLAISEKMNAQIRGLDQAYRNAQDGISLLQTADGALNEIHSITQRMRELSVQAANGSLTADDRSYIQLEIDQLASQINDIATQTQFNGKKLLDGSSSILWSTTSNDLGVIVTGSLLGRDRFGQVTNAEGNYKITFSTKTTGSENVQKSNILTLKHGTKQTNVQIYTDEQGVNPSGLTNLQALNMVEGSWRIETRERPFGGVRYYNDGALIDPLAQGLGVTDLTVTSTPHTVAFGEYDMRVANKVPMMATFDTAVVDGVNISSSNLSRDIDVKMDTLVNQTGSGGVTTAAPLYDDAAGGAGGAATVGINTDTNANIFTRYEILETDKRDTLRGPIQLIESYVTGDNAQIDMTLTYRSKAADQTTATFTYAAGGTSSVKHESTWKTSGAQTITYRLDTWDAVSSTWVNGTDQTIAIAGGSDLEAIQTAMTAALGGVATVTHVVAAGQSFISVENIDGANTRLSFSGGFADDLRLSGRDLTSIGAGNTANYDFDTQKNYKVSRTTSISAGQSIETICTNLNTSFAAVGGGSVTLNTAAGQSRLEFHGATAGAYGGNEITITESTGSAWSEIGMTGTSVATGATANGRDVYNGFTRDMTVGGQNIEGVATALAAGVNTGGVTGFAAAASAGDISHITLSNNSMYNIRISGGSTMSELNGGSITVDRGAADVDMSRNVYNSYTTSTAVIKNGRMNDVQTQLNNTLNYALTHNQSLTGGRTNLFGLTGGNNSNRQLTLNNAAQTTTAGDPPVTTTREVYYDIQLTNHTGATTNVLDEINFNVNAARDSATVSSNGMAWQLRSGTIGSAGMEMEQVFTAINAHTYLTAAWTADDPTVDGSHWGSFTVKNDHTDASGAARRSYGTESSGGSRDALNQTRGIGNLDLTYGVPARMTETWQTRDAFKVRATAQGNFNNGNVIDVTRTIGQANAAAYGDRANTSRDWLWEGGATESARNTNKMNAQFGNAVEGGLYTSFQVGDTSKESQIDKGDSWILFTQAKTNAANATFVKVNVGDSKTGDQKEVTYAFNKGVVSGDRAATINQMLHEDRTKYELLQHHIDFGATADDDATSLQYGERAGAMDAGYTVDDWRMGQEVDAWYSHAYYGDNTTYYFHNSTPDAVIEDITVNRQNDINASIMFYVKEGQLRYAMRGFDDAYANVIGDAATPKDDIVTVNADGSADIEGIKFDKLKINTGLMGEGDKFVVNVAAAAKLETGKENLTGAADKFQSYANIQVTGSPFQNDAAGSTAQYRFKNDAENGKTQMNMLGFYISPANGGSTALGVGYYDGVIQLNTAADGFHADSIIGSTDPTTQSAGAYIVHTEVNYQGKTQFSAGALVTSSHFQAMDITGSKLVVADFIEGISYSDYKFGMRGDNTYGWLNDTDKQQYSDMNGSLVFEVLKSEPDMLTFRVQGHFIDRDGNEYYAEEESFKLNQGRNTDKDVSDPGANNDDPHISVHMFKDSEFGGVFFDEFKIGDVSNWMAGDRFTVALTASGFIDGKPTDKQLDPNDPEYSKVDEIGIFSDNRGTTMPASFRFNEGVLDNTTIDLKMYQLTKNLVKENSDNFYHDQVMDGTLSLSFGDMYNEDDQDRTVRTAATFDVLYGRGDDYGVAHYYSNVEDIAEFYDKNGRFILDGGNEMLTIRQGDRETTISVESGMEVGELTNRLSSAVWNDVFKQYQPGLRGETDALDMSADKQYMMREEDKNKIIQFVNTVPGKSTNEAVAGTILAHSVIAGEQSALEFYGSEDMMKALGFNTVQQGTNTVFSADVVDAHTGQTLTTGTRVVAGSTSFDVMMDGVALKIDTDLGLRHATFDEAKGSFKLDVRDQFSEVIHLADNSTQLQIGANEGENMVLRLGDMSTAALGIENLSVRSQSAAARSVTRIDNAINFISKQRAVIGAQINRLEHTMSNLQKSSLDLQNSRSRIVEADMAKEMMNHTRINIVTQAGMSMLSQANQLGSNVLSLLR